MRVGSDRLIDVDIRLITATNRDLEAAVREGSFRSDLFYRLNVLPIIIPPLRKRKEDILPLLQHFLGTTFKNIPPAQLRQLTDYNWPGNIRELENIATYYQTLSTLPPQISQQNGNGIPLRLSGVSINLAILKEIRDHTQLSHGIGRVALIQSLSQRNIKISDFRLRSELAALQEKGYIEVGKGRLGTKITETGLDFLAHSNDAM